MHTGNSERFDRYHRKIQLALRLLHHGARSQTASEWSGLTPDQLATARRRWLPEANEGFRGPAPTSFVPFFRSTQRLHYATLFASIHQGLCRNAPRFGRPLELQPGLENGERLCLAYEILRQWAPDNDIELDQAVLLARGAVSGKDIQLICCLNCRSVMLIDTLARRHELCTTCRRR